MLVVAASTVVVNISSLRPNRKTWACVLFRRLSRLWPCVGAGLAVRRAEGIDLAHSIVAPPFPLLPTRRCAAVRGGVLPLDSALVVSSSAIRLCYVFAAFHVRPWQLVALLHGRGSFWLEPLFRHEPCHS